MMAEPPSDAGGVNDTVACSTPLDAEMPDGVSGVLEVLESMTYQVEPSFTILICSPMELDNVNDGVLLPA